MPTADSATPSESPAEPNFRDDLIVKYTPYLEEIQGKIFQIIIVFLVFGVIGAVYYQQILRFVMHLFNLSGINLVMTNPYQFISLAINTGVVIGVIAASLPLIFHFLNFLRPALLPGEFKLLLQMIPTSFLLFIVGFGFGVWVVQFVITLFSQTTLDFAVGNLWDIGHFFSQIILTGLILALVFQLPIIVTALIRFQIVPYATLVKQRRYVYAILLLIAAFMPPTDIVSLILLTVPPLLLFEVALLLNHPNRLPQGRKGGEQHV